MPGGHGGRAVGAVVVAAPWSFWLLAAKDSLGSPRKECGSSQCSTPPPTASPAPPGEGKG